MVKFKRLFSGVLALSVAMSIFMLGTLTAAAALSWDGSKITFEADTETLTDPWEGTVTKVDGFGGKAAGDKSLKITGDFNNSDYSHGFKLAENETLAASTNYYVDFIFFATGDYDAVRVELYNKSEDGSIKKPSTGDKFLSLSGNGTATYHKANATSGTTTGTWEPGKWHRLTLRYSIQSGKAAYMYAYLDGKNVINKAKPFSTNAVNVIHYLRISVKDETPDEGETPALYLDNLSYYISNNVPSQITSVDYTINRNGGIYSDGSNLYTPIGTSVGSILDAISVTDGTAVVCGSDLFAKSRNDLFAAGDTVVLSDTDGTLYQTLDISSDSIVAGQDFDDSTGTVPGVNYASTENGNPTIAYSSEAIYGKSSTGYALVNSYNNITTTDAVSGFLNICQASSGAPLWAKNGTANILPEALTYEYTFLAEGDYNYVNLAGRWDFYDASAAAEVTKRSQQFLKIYGDGSVVYGNAENPEPGIKILPGEWVNVQLTVRPQLNTYSVVVNGYILVGSATITEYMDANEDIPRGFGWFGPGIAFAENVSDESAAFYLGDWSVKIGEYVTDGYEASVNYPDVSSDNKIIYIPESVAKSDFITACAIPENATMKIYTDRTLNTEVASTARVDDGNVCVVTSENGRAIGYFDIKVGGLGLGDIELINNNDGTYTASTYAWYTLKEGETTQPSGILILAVYNQDGSLSHMSADPKEIADGNGTDFSATAIVEENQTVKAMLWDSYASLIPYTEAKTE